MEMFKIKQVSELKNKGEAKEQDLRFFYTGQMIKPDNRPASECGDYEDIQIKSAKASIGYGLTVKEAIAHDVANRFAYITEDRTVYMMSREEFEIFLNEFTYIDRDSHTHKTKIRLKSESKKMLEWLMVMA